MKSSLNVVLVRYFSKLTKNEGKSKENEHNEV
jgi:hypothetical protein